MLGTAIRHAGTSAIIFAVLAAFGIAVSREAGNVAIFWPANGAIVVLTAFADRRALLPILTGAALANLAVQLAYGDGLAFSLGLVLANGVEIAICALLVRIVRRNGPPHGLEDIAKVIGALVAGVVPAALLGGSIVAVTFGKPAASCMLTWFMSDLASALVVVPPFLTASRRNWDDLRHRLASRDLVLLRDVAILVLLAALAVLALPLHDLQVVSLFALPLLWSAIRFGVFPTAAISSFTALAVIWLIHAGRIDVMLGDSLAEEVLFAKTALVLIALPPLFVAAAIENTAAVNRLLAEKERKLSLVLDSLREGLWDWNIATGEVAFSERWLEIVGYQPGELPGHVTTWHLIGEPSDQARIQILLQEHFAGNTTYYEAEQRLRHKDGHWIWVLDRGMVVERDRDGRPLRAVGTISDIRGRKAEEAELRRRAHQDMLTGIGNRAHLEEMFARRLMSGDRGFSLLLIDLDRFKPVNDNHGHDAGDHALKVTAERIRACLRPTDVVARIGGDEFAALVETPPSGNLSGIASRLATAIGDEIAYGETKIRIGASIGYASVEDVGTSFAEIYKAADERLYMIKRREDPASAGSRSLAPT
ncbi:sensor domain-containing diguanylate cyclase [Methylobrevis pamukkalensis]|uniref:Putative diguanylate cyclase YegE n=1 Tax=Methylobrevis pamukkalensis TaxID=1439726 RepID=A0A1E3H3E3_9HYPH|nr:sensor domain-containing diguanylate cyclase [Methylobrevis pamukkalensis]ODN70838.1 putative diguanylate cyclase YegE [Methylobrevis pamukkalensis]